VEAIDRRLEGREGGGLPRDMEKEEAVVTRRWRRRGSSEGTKRFPCEWGLVGGSS